MNAEQFQVVLGNLCAEALNTGQMNFGQVVAALEFAKLDTVELARQQARAAATQNVIVIPPGRETGL